MNIKKWYFKLRNSQAPATETRPLKFLIIRLDPLAEIMLTTPVIRCLRKKYPQSVIHFLTGEKFAALVGQNPYLDKILAFKEGFKTILKELEDEQYDHIIDLHHNLRTLRMKNSLRETRFHSFQKLSIKKWFYVNFKINGMPKKHLVDRYFSAVVRLGVTSDGLGLDYFLPEDERIKEGDIPFSHSQGYVVIAMGTSHNTKRLPIEKLKELAGTIRYPIILLGGEEDIESGRMIAQQDPIKIYDACGKFSLNESADIIRKATFVISHDTAMMHIAAAFHKPVLSIWGNTVPSFGMTPYKTTFEVFQVNHLWCRPCSAKGFDNCPLGHFKCMKNQSIDQISASVEAMVRGNKSISS